MTKEKDNIARARLLMALGAILVAIVSSFFIVRARTVANEKANTLNTWDIKDAKALAQSANNKLAVEGCKPSQENEVSVAVIASTIDDMEKDIEEVRKDVKTFRAEQTIRHTELLKAIREK